MKEAEHAHDLPFLCPPQADIQAQLKGERGEKVCNVPERVCVPLQEAIKCPPTCNAIAAFIIILADILYITLLNDSSPLHIKLHISCL